MENTHKTEIFEKKGEFMKFILMILLLSHTALSYSGPYVDDLQKCLTQSSSEKDVIILIRWLAKAINAHPNLSDISKLDEKKKIDIDKKMANYFEKIIEKECKNEFDNVSKYEGANGITVAFEFLGKSSMMQLMQNQNVNNSIEEFTKYLK